MKASLKQCRHKLSNPQETKANLDSGLWVKAAKAVIYSGKRISHAAKVLFVILRDYQGENEYAWPSVATLAADMECSERYVQELLRELEAVEAIEIIEQAGWVSLYRVCLLELKAGQPTNDQLPRFNQEGTIPPNYSSPLPPNYSSPKLEPLELDKTVCETAPNGEKGKGSERDITQAVLTAEVPSNFQTTSIRDKSCNSESETKHTQPAAGGLAPAQTEIVSLLIGQGMATIDACRLAAQAHNTKAHVTSWIAYACSHAHNPAGYLVKVLDRQDAQPPNPKTKKTSTSRPTNNKPLITQTPPIDFTKYTDNGKYAYLTKRDEIHLAQSDLAHDEKTNQLNDQTDTLPNPPSTQTFSTTPAATATDQQIKYAIRGFDREAFDWLQLVHVEGSTLQVRFNGQKQFNAAHWLRHLDVFGVKHIEVR